MTIKSINSVKGKISPILILNSIKKLALQFNNKIDKNIVKTTTKIGYTNNQILY